MRKRYQFVWLVLILTSLLYGCASPPKETAVTWEENAASQQKEATEPIEAVRISEVMIKNHSTICDADDSFPDWFELENMSDKEIALEGWSISDGKASHLWQFPALNIPAGGRTVVFASGKNLTGDELHTGFSLSQGDTLSLYDRYGRLADTFSCIESEADQAQYRDEEGEVRIAAYPSPGFPNTGEGYDQWQSSLAPSGPLVINEVMTANYTLVKQNSHGYCDWVEIKNISSQPVQLKEFYLSDSEDNYLKWRLPDMVLGPGELAMIFCDGTDTEENGSVYSSFSLDSSREQLFLSTEESLTDYAALYDIPFGCSLGRLEGESGFFRFQEPTPGRENETGCRRVTEEPIALSSDGIFNGTEEIKVELSSPYAMYYTTDGSLPTEESKQYTGPFSVSETMVVRVIAKEEGALPSRALTLNYILNEVHSLPVLSLVSDEPDQLRQVLNNRQKGVELPGCLALYEPEGGFKANCGISLAGETSTIMSKKSLKIHFRGTYGEEMVSYDIFDSDIQEFSSLTIRAGQDNHDLIFRNEIWQDICFEMSDSVLSQYSKFCILYLNGEYYGIYSLKEDLSKHYYASHTGVSKDRVEVQKFPAKEGEPFYEEVFRYCLENDMSDEENFRQLCGVVDINSLIDWFVIEGVSGNRDIRTNIRFFRSPENGNRWQLALFDLDVSLKGSSDCFGSLLGYGKIIAPQMNSVLKRLLQNETFTDMLAERYAQVYNTALSNEKLLEKIDQYEDLLRPEVERDWWRWDRDPAGWDTSLAYTKRLINEGDWQNSALNSFFFWTGLSDEYRTKYFSG